MAQQWASWECFESVMIVVDYWQLHLEIPKDTVRQQVSRRLQDDVSIVPRNLKQCAAMSLSKKDSTCTQHLESIGSATVVIPEDTASLLSKIYVPSNLKRHDALGQQNQYSAKQ